MMAWWLLPLPAVVGLYALLRTRGYAAIYKMAHLDELARGVLSLFERGPAGLAPTAEPLPAFVTGARVAVVLTRASNGGGGRYHLSLSRQGDVLAQGAALTLVAFLLDVVGVDAARAAVSTSPNVTHAEFEMSAEEEHSLAGSSLPTLDEQRARERLGRAMRARSRMTLVPHSSSPTR